MALDRVVKSQLTIFMQDPPDVGREPNPRL